eukprot:m.76608 g.76608  ORF g.76608 m.76608 type:complete len:337 (+) comp17237_c0_seq3:841-1851(+)
MLWYRRLLCRLWWMPLVLATHFWAGFWLDSTMIPRRQISSQLHFPLLSTKQGNLWIAKLFSCSLALVFLFARVAGEHMAFRGLGRLANATGAANCCVLGALPDHTASQRIQDFLQGEQSALVRQVLAAAPDLTKAAGQDSNEDPVVCSVRQSYERDSAALQQVCQLAADQIKAAVSALAQCQGRVFTSGLGKSGFVAARFAASLSSIGVPAQFVHASEWTHGDIGAYRAGQDVAVFFSHSGSTAECIQAALVLKERGGQVLSVVGQEKSTLGAASTSVLAYDKGAVSDHIHAPTASVVLQEAISNALLCAVVDVRGLTAQDLQRNHPGGAIGRLLV